MSDSQVYPVTVPADLTLAQMIEASKNKYVDPDITSEYFPDVGPTGDCELVLVHIGRDISTEDATAAIRARGLELASIGMLLAFGEKYPEIQREFPVAALGSVTADSYGSGCSPCLSWYGPDRVLDLCSNGSISRGICRFLAYRKVG